jgi:chromosome segregation ATPase
MAARRSKQPEATGAEARAFTIVLEEIRAQNKGFGEGQQLLREQMGGLRHEMGGLRDEMGGLRDELGGLRHEMGVLRDELGGLREEMRAGFAQVDRRFEHVDRRLDRLEQDVGLVKIAVVDHSRDLKEIRAALGNKVDRHELETLVARGMR